MASIVADVVDDSQRCRDYAYADSGGMVAKRYTPIPFGRRRVAHGT